MSTGKVFSTVRPNQSGITDAVDNGGGSGVVTNSILALNGSGQASVRGVLLASSFGFSGGSILLDNSGDVSGVAKTWVLPTTNGTTGQVLGIASVASNTITTSWQTPATPGFPATATVVSQTATGPTQYTTADRGKIWHNIGAAGTVTYQLPATASIGDTYWAMGQNTTNTVHITQGNSSDVIKMPTFTTATGTSHGIQYSLNGRNGPGIIALTYIATNTWVSTGGYPFDWATL